MITLHVAYTYRGKRCTTTRRLDDRSRIGDALDNLDLCGYDNIEIVEVEGEDKIRDDWEDIPF